SSGGFARTEPGTRRITAPQSPAILQVLRLTAAASLSRFIREGVRDRSEHRSSRAGGREHVRARSMGPPNDPSATERRTPESSVIVRRSPPLYARDERDAMRPS